LADNKKKIEFKNIWRFARWVLLGLVLISLTLAVFIAVDGLTDELQPVDVAVVMGTTVNRDGTPSRWLKTRLDRTLELYQQGYFTNIIVSGGVEKNGQDEAQAMRNYLVANGVPIESILVDRNGSNTFATAKNVALIMSANHWQSAMVISQFYHVPRVKLALHRVGIVEVYGAHARWITWQSVFWLLREVVAYPVYFLRAY
jgi:vancomycin permeability regulator SanA